MLLATAVFAQDARPGVQQDSWQQIELRPLAPGECLEIDAGKHTIRLALADLRVMAVDAGSVMGAQTEAPLKRLFERRTQELLGRVAGWPAGGGCVQAPAAQGDDRFVVAELLKAGRAAVRAGGQGAASIWMRHFGRRTGPLSGRGEILFYTERAGEPFFSVTWWVS